MPKRLSSKPLVPKQLGMLLLVLLISGCGTTSAIRETPLTDKVQSNISPDLTYPIDVYDPWEGFNRRMYNFNAKFDRAIFIPVVNAYETVLPSPVEKGISNFFFNIGEIGNFINSVLQLKGRSAATAFSRFVLNTTVGLLGILDPASHLGLDKKEEDFGQTLAYWGMGSGPYLVMPLLGPSSLRDTTGFMTDSLVFDERELLNFDDHSNRDAIYLTLKAIDARHRVEFRYLQGGTPFEYEKVRYLYLKKREFDALK